METTPWSEPAVLTRYIDITDPTLGREIVMQGTLTAVVAHIRKKKIDYFKGLVITFPDRGQPPFSYAGNKIVALLAETPTD